MHVSVFRRVALLTVALLLGAWLRLWFIHTYPQVNGDSLLYGEMAKNLILHGIYGRVQDGSVHPTLIRLPGYPLFLAACFRIFGMENYRAVLYLQAGVDLASCLLIAGCVRLLRGARQAWIALFLAVLCPFTANYVSNALSETLSIFCVALALYGMALLMTRPGAKAIALLAFAFSFAALLRPDGALAGNCVFAGDRGLRSALWISGGGEIRRAAQGTEVRGGLRSAGGDSICAVDNAQLEYFHVFEPLAPRYATDPGETTMPGLQRWTKTWLVDFASTYEIYWNVDNDRLDINAMPSRAFDSAGAVRGDAADLRGAQQNKYADPRRLDARLREAGGGTNSRQSPALLRVGAAGESGEHVAASSSGSAARLSCGGGDTGSITTSRTRCSRMRR